MSAPAAGVKAPVRPYRRFLISAFHTRFGHASLLALLICWDTAFWVGPKSSFLWSWFPIGPAGLRTILLFISTLLIFILRVSTLKIGKRTASSPWTLLRNQLLSFSTFKIFVSYVFSAWWFGEIYVISTPSKDMGWVNRGDVSSPDRLNERPIYLRAIFLMLALVQSCIHIYLDSSAVPIPVAPPPQPSSTEQSTHPTIRVSESLKKDVLPIVTRCVKIAAATCLLGPFVYTLSMRNLLWSWQLAFAKLYYNLPRSDARPSGYPPSRPGLMFTSFWVGFLLLFTWEASSFLFTTLLAQAPLKKGHPLSAGSKDPNGTLLNGVKSKTDTVKTFAFWELALIARLYPDRRKAILADIERPGGACWSQMQVTALDVIRGISLRVSPPKQEVKPAQRVDPNALQIERMPKIAQPMIDKPVLLKDAPPQSRMERIETISGNVAKTFTQSGRPWNPTQSPAAAKAKDVLEQNSPRRLMQRYPQVQEHLEAIQASPIGNIFRTTRQQVVNALVLGDGHGNAAVIVDAGESVTRMLVASLSEDVYGKAVAGVPDAVRVFAQAITDVETYVDVNAKGLAGGIDEVDIVVQRLKAGLTELLSAFQMYLADVGLSIHELNLAKAAAAKRNLLQGQNGEKPQIKGATSGAGMQSKMANGQPLRGPKRDEGVRNATKQSQRRLVAPREQTKFDWGEGAGTERLFPQREKNWADKNEGSR